MSTAASSRKKQQIEDEDDKNLSDNNYKVEAVIPNPYSMRMIVESFAKNSSQATIYFQENEIHFQSLNQQSKVYTSYRIDGNSILHYGYNSEKAVITIQIIFSSLNDAMKKVKKTNSYIILRLTKSNELLITLDCATIPIQLIDKINERFFPVPEVKYLARMPNDFVSKMLSTKGINSLKFDIYTNDILITAFNKIQGEISKTRYNKGISNLDLDNFNIDDSINFEINISSIELLKNVEKANTRGVCQIGVVENDDDINLVVGFRGDNYSIYNIIIPKID